MPNFGQALASCRGHSEGEDARYWFDNSVFPTDEAAARFYHRLTFVHPFPNGNGRHARLLTDVLLVARGRPWFTWGQSDLHRAGYDRDQYVEALRAADGQNFSALYEFLQLSSRTESGLGTCGGAS